MPPTFVIVGASLAGGTAAATLRQDGFDGEVILIGAEPQPPYERPPLSKQYLRGEVPFEKALVRPGGFYEQNRIETLFASRRRGWSLPNGTSSSPRANRCTTTSP